jgi:chromosome segregation protein
MLKALELLGFKSFADKTRFEFPSGITVVVGPNGSGKSNVVDAIKWVLGEQSVKSLRGKEMADVIFNGSGARRGMNSAEITLTFDNSKRLFPIDSPDVHITRRVYRSGEGEYLINRNPARLRDIRDLLSGTGMGTHAYSVIEQGKVDVLLQSSPRERRVIFEEAAGISRFKARKLETLRRLERVDQNLLRLSDIVDEVESRLRGVRAQAGKARRYKEHSDRLQELRTQVGLVDWTRLTERLAKFQEKSQALTDERDELAARGEAVEAELIKTDSDIQETSEGIRQSEARIAENRERIATFESTVEHERDRVRDLETEIERRRQQLVGLNARAGDLQQQLSDLGGEVEEAEGKQQAISLKLVERERELTDVIRSLDELRGENEQRRTEYVEHMRMAAELGNETTALQTRLDATEAACNRSRARLNELEGQRDTVQTELQNLRRGQEEMSSKADANEALLHTAKDELAEHQRDHALQLDELTSLREQHSRAAERANVLEELQRRQEGLSAGVKEVLAHSQEPSDGPFRGVCGLVADLLNVSVEVAPLIEVALGQTAQHVVVESREPLLSHLQSETYRFAGRVGFVWLDSIDTPSQTTTHETTELATAGQGTTSGNPDPTNLNGKPGVLGRADRFVETEPRYAPLTGRLLGSTWVVETLAHAVSLSKSSEAGTRFVTLAGEFLGEDGTVIVGPQHVSTGLIARRSQLRALQEQLTELDGKIETLVSTSDELQRRIETQTQKVEGLENNHRESVESLSEQRFKITASEERAAELGKQHEVVAAELRAATAQHGTAETELADAQQKRQQIDAKLADMEAGLAELDERTNQLESQRQAFTRETTQIKIDLAKSEERLRNLQSRMRQFEDTREERERAISDGHHRLQECKERADASQWTILRAESEIAELYLRKETFAQDTVALINQRESFREARSQLTSEAQSLRSKVRKIEEQIHKADLAASEVQHERGTLADRLREDYEIELAELEHEPSEEEQHQREAVQTEIEELRRKINNLGSVNTEALQELEELDTRYETLSTQYKDLVAAKESLEGIIEKINADSRRLFTETLHTVKGHFEKLFRDLFGGGRADIILDDEEDILESGIEIVARPPGKEPRSISLLSGGEKTMTCVALLLAIFRSRPSPFCVLDEVDAALDEANIDRFTHVVQEFLTWTQFIIVTHSKKTMTAANTIYGITMQESGVSKQVSVRFEDVSEDGHISKERLEEAEREEAAAAGDDDTQAA